MILNNSCTGINDDCEKCPAPQNMTNGHLTQAILFGANEDCIKKASKEFALRLNSKIENATK